MCHAWARNHNVPLNTKLPKWVVLPTGRHFSKKNLYYGSTTKVALEQKHEMFG